MLIAGTGERDLDVLCAALERRGIESIVIDGAIESAVRSERPNLVLLVGDAARDDGARGIDEVRRAGQTPVVVATDPEPLDRRLAPFQYGASGIVVRRGDPEEMAGELQHLLGENARRIAERNGIVDGSSEELDGLVGLGSRELRMSRTPIEGISRRDIILPAPDRGDRGSDPLPRIHEETTVERDLSAVSIAEGSGVALPDWDEDLITKRQPRAELARWRRLSAADRGLLRTPEMLAALDRDGVPRAPRGLSDPEGRASLRARDPNAAATARIEVPEVEIERAIARSRGRLREERDAQTVPATRAISAAPAPVGEPDVATSAEGSSSAVHPSSPAPPPGARPSSSPGTTAAPRQREADDSGSARPEGAPAEPEGPSAATEGAPPEAPALQRAGEHRPSERISSSALLALSAPPRGPIEDRASTLRAQAITRPRASAKAAMIGLVALFVCVSGLSATRWLQRMDEEGAALARSTTSADVASRATGELPPVIELGSAPAPDGRSLPAGDPRAGARDEDARARSSRDGDPSSSEPTTSDSGGADDRARSDALVREGRSLERDGDRTAALERLEEAVRVDPENPHARVALARAHLAAGAVREALVHAERAVALRRRRAEYHVLLGDARAAAGDREGAQLAWRSALEIEPDHAAALARLAR